MRHSRLTVRDIKFVNSDVNRLADTGDAMFYQRELCGQIVDSGGGYLFVVKNNQPEQKAAVEFSARFSTPTTKNQRHASPSEAPMVSKRHGRTVQRHLQASTRLAGHLERPGLIQVSGVDEGGVRGV